MRPLVFLLHLLYHICIYYYGHIQVNIFYNLLRLIFSITDQLFGLIWHDVFSLHDFPTFSAACIMHIVRSWRCDWFVTWFCYQLITKPGNKTASHSHTHDLTHLLWVSSVPSFKIIMNYIYIQQTVMFWKWLIGQICPLDSFWYDIL